MSFWFLVNFGFIVGLMLLTIVVIALLLWGSTRMYRLNSYRLAVATAVLVMLPVHLGCILGIPIGIWALIVLADPKVKAAFAQATEVNAGKR